MHRPDSGGMDGSLISIAGLAFERAVCEVECMVIAVLAVIVTVVVERVSRGTGDREAECVKDVNIRGMLAAVRRL